MRRPIAILAILILAVSLVVFLLWQFRSPGDTTVGNLPILPGVDSTVLSKYPPREVPLGLQEFRSDVYGFSLLYPQDFVVRVEDEGGGASTIMFENNKTIDGFQIFIVPFEGSQITDDRFKRDIPSGVRKNIKNIQVDGATGASFYSVDASLGETAEVWFIRGGYLYEVNTFKDLDIQLSNILATLKFL
jgi:hypothetical protein